MFLIPLLVAGLLLPSSLVSKDEGALTEITPIQVYSLWVNINEALMDFAHVKNYPNEFISQLESIEEIEVEGKIPADVFSKVGEFIAIFSSTSNQNLTSHGNSIEGLEEEVFSVLRPSDGSVIPPMVFLRSTVVLDFLAQEVAEHQKVKHSDGVATLISPYFELHQYDNKTPNDVYVQVVKGLTRLQLMSAFERGE